MPYTLAQSNVGVELYDFALYACTDEKNNYFQNYIGFDFLKPSFPWEDFSLLRPVTKIRFSARVKSLIKVA